MRKLLIPLLLLPQLCVAQKNYCKKVSKKTDDIKGTITYSSPDSKYLAVIKQIKGTDTIFSLHIHIKDAIAHYERAGATVVFTDGTELTNDDVQVHCTQEASVVTVGPAASTHASGYLLYGFFPLTRENIEKFKTGRIARVSLHNALQKVPEKDAIWAMRYIQCIENPEL